MQSEYPQDIIDPFMDSERKICYGLLITETFCVKPVKLCMTITYIELYTVLLISEIGLDKLRND